MVEIRVSADTIESDWRRRCRTAAKYCPARPRAAGKQDPPPNVSRSIPDMHANASLNNPMVSSERSFTISSLTRGFLGLSRKSSTNVWDVGGSGESHKSLNSASGSPAKRLASMVGDCMVRYTRRKICFRARGSHVLDTRVQARSAGLR